MQKNQLQKLLQSIKLPKAEWIGLRNVHEITTYLMSQDGRFENCHINDSEGVMVEVLVGGQIAYAATPDLTPGGIQRAAEKAFEFAQASQNYKIYPWSQNIRSTEKGMYQSPHQKSFNELQTKNAFDLLIKTSETIKNHSNHIIRSQAMARIVQNQTNIVSTSGTEIEQDLEAVSISFSSTAQKGNVVQTRTNSGHDGRSYQIGAEIFEDASIWQEAARVAEESVELLDAQECPEMTTDLVLMPDQMMLQIHESVGHPLEIDRILGDERNYAGSSFVKLTDFGSLQYGSNLMNITFDPTVANEFASYAYDDTGLKAEKEYLIKEGLLIRGLGGKESQIRSERPGTANTRASLWNRPPIDRMANLNLEPGNSSFDEILSSIEDGVLMWANRSWSIDDYRRKFQFGCEYAKRIRNGKCAETLRNPNYRGVSSHFWKNLKKIGNKETWKFFGTPYCGKGEPNQVIRVGHGSPVCLFKEIEVFGGAS